jgi:putative hydrolase of the HAD superfamily
VVGLREFELVGLDGDDTLWECQRHFDEVTEVFRQIVAPHVVDPAVDVTEVLDATERRHLPIYGFGVKAFMLSMIEAALDLTDGALPAEDLRRLIEEAKSMMVGEVTLLPGVGNAVDALSRDHRLMLVTKGDLLDQRRKLDSSGLADYFEFVEIVHDKTPAVYRNILDRRELHPSRFVMAGDSLRSDIVPVVAIGATAVHVPHSRVWAHEVVVAEHDVPVLSNLGELSGWLANR